MSKPNRDILSGGERYHHRKAKAHRVDEVTFDKEKRIDFLTGFHKRKLQRKKHAQELAEEQNKQQRIEERAKIREERKERVQLRLAELQKIGDSIKVDDEDDDDEETEEKEEPNNDKKRKRVTVDEEWHGFDEGEDSNGDIASSGRGILKVRQVYKIESNEGPVIGTSEVTIEPLENPNVVDVSDIAKMNNVDLSKSGKVLEDSINRAKDYARLLGMDDEYEEPKRQKKKKKDRKYLSKRERKIKQLKDKKASLHRKNR
ncbi:DEKNAAC101061 [Brettanomyces naardenensis]|uniref:DEKNAAC101061 n=1 Tax=Brettanomyces naardenensis TaxID=13370 RepID=A0A448YGU6_BRENA|nr:DEKNAAC101061 [Brettanomyces naardenensis]